MAGDSSARKVSVADRPDPESFLDHEAAAEYIGRKSKTLYGYCSEGRIPRVRDGRRSLYRVSDLDALAASLRQDIPASVVTKT
ncbi:MAG: helix-turn-helix domain-containing protein [Gemmatimonadota bacterium]